MLRILILVFIAIFLAGCNLLNLTNSKSNDEYARCKEIKRQLIFLNATNDERLQTQRAAEIDNLYRSYRDNGCY